LEAFSQGCEKRTKMGSNYTFEVQAESEEKFLKVGVPQRASAVPATSALALRTEN
jgi:hypothetical protein